MIDAFQSSKRRRRQVWHSPRDLSEEDDAVLVGNWGDCIDEFCGRFFAKTADKQRASFASAHSPESAGGSGSNI
jgi:hypothetical protein